MIRSTYSRGPHLVSETLLAMVAGKELPVGDAFGGSQGLKLEKEI